MTPFVSRSVMGKGFCEPCTSALPRTNTVQALAHTKSHIILPCFFNEISAKICGLNLTPTCTAPSLSSFSVELILHNLQLLERNLEGRFPPAGRGDTWGQSPARPWAGNPGPPSTAAGRAWLCPAAPLRSSPILC